VPPNKIDVAGSLRGQISVTPDEHPDDRAARLRAEQRAALIENGKGVAVFAVLLLALVGLGLLAVYEGVFDATASAETRHWAQTILAALVTGAISFVVGRKIGR
jgi:hypothetical protein